MLHFNFGTSLCHCSVRHQLTSVYVVFHIVCVCGFALCSTSCSWILMHVSNIWRTFCFSGQKYLTTVYVTLLSHAWNLVSCRLLNGFCLRQFHSNPLCLLRVCCILLYVNFTVCACPSHGGMTWLLHLASSEQWCWSGERGILTELSLCYSIV